ncbi:MAG: hypothetical protein RMN24_06890 [Anaerolineae bacterium]|nr:hypothetical protein [Anaerolineae bacterium]
MGRSSRRRTEDAEHDAISRYIFRRWNPVWAVIVIGLSRYTR